MVNIRWVLDSEGELCFNTEIIKRGGDQLIPIPLNVQDLISRYYGDFPSEVDIEVIKK